MRKPFRVVLSVALGLAVLSALGVANNNLRLQRPTAAEFQARLDRSLKNSIDWEAGLSAETNAYLLYMVRDSAALTGAPQLHSLVERSKPALLGNYLARFVEPDARFIVPPPKLERLPPYERWLAHAISRGEYPLNDSDRAELFEPDRARTGRATHQLFALIQYRQFLGATPELDRLIRHLSERIAGEAVIDFRVTDLYLQRVAFLLAAGQPDLVQPRWVERALAAQDANGGWYNGWYGWAPNPLRFEPEDFPDNHATAQGLWLAAMLKHRYPEWIRRHYPH